MVGIKDLRKGKAVYTGDKQIIESKMAEKGPIALMNYSEYHQEFCCFCLFRFGKYLSFSPVLTG